MRHSSIGLVVALLGFLAARTANAFCEDAGSVINCFSNFVPANEASDHAVIAFVGNDPNFSNTQFISWRIKDTGQCLEWDQIPNSTGGLHKNLTISGSDRDDTVRTPTASGATMCGFFINLPIQNGFAINMIGNAGADAIGSFSLGGPSSQQYFGNNLSTTETSGNIISTVRADVLMFGDLGQDLLTATGGGSGGIFFAGGGNDIVNIKKTASPLGVNCGPGLGDKWCGPGSRPSDCEITTTQCNSF